MNRDRALERELLATAGRSMGMEPVAANLDDFADRRAHPGPVRLDGRDFMVEAAEELADCANYLRWEIQRLYPKVLEGDSVACRDYEQAMRSLSHLIPAYHSLLVPAA